MSLSGKMIERVDVRLQDEFRPWRHAVCSGIAVWGRGYASLEGAACDDQELVARVAGRLAEAEAQTPAEVLDLVEEMDGGWALVVRLPKGFTCAVVDRMRTIPLFYTVRKGRAVIAASADDCGEPDGGLALDEGMAVEFLLAGYVAGNRTLYQDICQVEPGTAAIFEDRDGPLTATTRRYHAFYPRQCDRRKEEELVEELAITMRRSFDAVVASARGPFVVPVSGGLDSRLIVAMLRLMGREDVVCYTYGPAKYVEIEISKRVAEAVRYPWHWVEYTGQRWADVFRGDFFAKYLDYACKGVSVPCPQELPAILVLRERGVVGDDAVFFPGYSLDMLAGSRMPWYPDGPVRSKQDVVRQIIRHNFTFWELPPNDRRLRQVAARIRESLPAEFGGAARGDLASFEMWDARNRQALYIINSVRSFEILGGRWRTLWMYPLMDFFLKLPPELRFDEWAYRRTLAERIFVGPVKRLNEIERDSGEMTFDGRRRTVSAFTKRGRQPRIGVRFTRWMLRRLSLVNRLMAARRPPQRSPLLFENWLADGNEPSSLTVRDVLDRHTDMRRLPADLCHIMEPFLGRRLDLMAPSAVLAAVVLGRICGRMRAAKG